MPVRIAVRFHAWAQEAGMQGGLLYTLLKCFPLRRNRFKRDKFVSKF